MKIGYDFGDLLTHVMHNGWLSPTGTFYPCKHYQHDMLADQINTEVIIDSRTINGTAELEYRG